MLADFSVEHYTWVASGDKRNPDATAVEERADAFQAWLGKLYNDGLIMALPGT